MKGNTPKSGTSGTWLWSKGYTSKPLLLANARELLAGEHFDCSKSTDCCLQANLAGCYGGYFTDDRSLLAMLVALHNAQGLVCDFGSNEGESLAFIGNEERVQA